MHRDKPEKQSKSSTNFLCLHNKNKVQLLDGASAILSARALCIAVYFFASRDSGQYMIQMSEANAIVAGNSTALYKNDPTQNTTKSLQATCKSKEDPRSILSMTQSMFLGFLLPLSDKNSFEIRAVQAKYNDVFYRDRYIPHGSRGIRPAAGADLGFCVFCCVPGSAVQALRAAW